MFLQIFKYKRTSKIRLMKINYYIVRAMVCEQMDLLLHSEICKSYSLGEIYETVVFMHMRGISTEKGLKIVDNFLLNLKGNEHNKYG